MINKISNKSDEQLYAMLSGNKASREAGFTELYQRHSKRIYQYSRRICGNDEMASDVLQEVFLRLLNSSQNNQQMTNVPAFLLRVARNYCIDLRKKQSHSVSSEKMEIPSYDISLESIELKHLLVIALDSLPEDQKEAIVLQAYSGLSYQEISETTNVPISTVRNWVVRGKKKLREILAPYIKELEQ
jgi:RNA polymerase sigma factor (sigma-70 family)